MLSEAFASFSEPLALLSLSALDLSDSDSALASSLLESEMSSPAASSVVAVVSPLETLSSDSLLLSA